MAVVYLSLAFPLVLRRYLRSRLSTMRVASSALLSSVVFFVTTNFAVWAFAGMYARGMEGFSESAIEGFLDGEGAGDELGCLAQPLVLWAYCGLAQIEGMPVNCFEMWWPGTELNRRRQPFQGCALPPELPGHFWFALLRPQTAFSSQRFF